MATPGEMNRRIVLVKPAASTASDSFGAPVAQGQPTRYPVWASWRERPGREAIIEEQEVGVFPVSIHIWWHEALADIDETWHLESERGEEYDITAISEVGGRYWQLELNAVKRA